MKEENKTGEIKLSLQRLSAARTETNEMESRDFYVNRTEYEMRPCGAEHENARKPAKPDTKPFRVLRVFRGSNQARRFGTTTEHTEWERLEILPLNALKPASRDTEGF